MAEEYTTFSEVYTAFFSKITDDMFLQLTLDDTNKILQELLISAIPKFEFPRVDLSYQKTITKDRRGNINVTYGPFNSKLNDQEINIIATYMVVEWLGQQLASVQNVRMKYSGNDFKFTSQANHMQKILQMKKDYEREGFHLQRLYKRRKKNKKGVYRSTLGQIMKEPEQEDDNADTEV